MSEEERQQEALVRAFSQGRVVGAPAPVERFDTHLSHVFVSGERAFKLKRAVRLPFVDFSSCEARRKACEAELANQPMARALYLGALPIVRDSNGFRIGGAGAAADWVVAMRRFEQDQQFDRLAARGALSRDVIEEAVETIAAGHRAAPATERAGYAAHYRSVIQGLRRTEQHGAREMGLEPGSPVLFDRLDEALARARPLIEARRKRGKVCRGHGDLHLRNLCLYEGRPLAFDALEFDEALATTDVLYDLAFLLMDLRRVGLAVHVNAAMNRYWDLAEEEEAALSLLPFFMSLRAAVRMAVAVEASDLNEAQTHRTLGLSLLARAPPILIAIGGLSGTGKTAVAQSLAPLMPGPAGARLLRSDVLRKMKLGLGLEEKAQGASYAPARRAEIYRDLAAKAAQAVGGGASAIADATLQERSVRDAISAAAGSARFFGYWLAAPLDVRLARVGSRTGDASDADTKVASEQSEPSDIGPPWRRLNANRPVAAIVNDILSDISLPER